MKNKLSLSREQQLATVELILDSAMWQIGTCLPNSISWADRLDMLNKVDDNAYDLCAYERGCLETAASALTSLFNAVVEGGSLCTSEALICAGRFDTYCGEFVRRSWQDKGEAFRQKQDELALTGLTGKKLYAYFGYPDVAEHAEAFVKMIDKCSTREVVVTHGVYLELFHGRKNPKDQMENWGEPGPVFGPFDFVHTTYRCSLTLGEDGVDLSVDVADDGEHGDCIYYAGIYYGDWSVFASHIFDGSKELQARHQVPDEAKATQPKKQNETKSV